MKNEKPNVLWIMTDEHRTDALGCYGSNWGNSPNIDALARKGVTFSNCTTQSPMCVPARAALFTGRYAHKCGGLVKFNTPMPDEVPLTWLFKDAGYQVIPENVHGKNMLSQMLGETHIPNRPTFSEADSSFSKAYGPCGSHRVMIRDGRWKLSYSIYDAGYGEDGSLYDLDTDPDELKNIYSQTDFRTIKDDLRQKISIWFDSYN